LLSSESVVLVPNFTLTAGVGFCVAASEWHCYPSPDNMVSFEMNDLKSMHQTLHFLFELVLIGTSICSASCQELHFWCDFLYLVYYL
jgi:hypothetical protein